MGLVDVVDVVGPVDVVGLVDGVQRKQTQTVPPSDDDAGSVNGLKERERSTPTTISPLFEVNTRLCIQL